MPEIGFTYSPWYLIPAIILLGLILYTLYYRKSDFSKGQTWILVGLRFVTFSLLILFLLKPYWVEKEEIYTKPHLIWLQDQSKSMRYHSDSLKLDAALVGLKDQNSTLDEKYQQQFFTFAQDLSEDSTVEQGFSDVYHALEEVQERFYGENVSAIVLTSDGIYNRGRNPLAFLERYPGTPVFTLVHGNKDQKSDLKIGQLRYSRELSLGQKLAVEIDLEATNRNGTAFTLQLKDPKGKVVQEKSYQITSANWFESLILELEAKQEGFQNYRLEILQAKADEEPENDRKPLVFKVVKEAFTLVIYSPEVSPDIGALRSALKNQLNWELTWVKDPKALKLKETKVLIAFDWDANLVKSITDLKVPTLFIAGADASLRELEGLGLGLGLTNEFENQFAFWNSDFGLFPNANTNQVWTNFPPILGLYGNLEKPDWAEVILQKQIGSIETKEPIALAGSRNGHRLAFFAGRSFWQWRVYNIRSSDNAETFDSFWQQLINYLNAQEKSERLILDFADQIYAGQKSKVLGKVYDESANLVNSSELKLKLQGLDGQRFDYSFTPLENYYRLHLPSLTSGFYDYDAEVTVGSETLVKRGRIYIEPNNLEKQDLLVRAELLADLSEQSGGQTFSIESWQGLVTELQNLDAPTQVSERKSNKELINLWQIFFLILAILGTEWFLRKYWGRL